VTRHGLILFNVEAAPLQRMKGCALHASHRAKDGPIHRPQAMIQSTADRISDRSGHPQTHRPSETARVISRQNLKAP